MVKISVIIPTYNRSNILKLCLESLLIQDFIGLYEVIVVDDGSEDNTKDVFYSLNLPKNFIYLYQNNLGPSAARNKAIKISKGELLIIINDDTICEKSLLSKHWKTYLENIDKKVSILGRFVFSEKLQRKFPIVFFLEKLDFLFPYSEISSISLNSFNYFWTCNISFPKKAVDDVGFFEEEINAPSYDDVEYGFRMEKAGYKVLYNENIYAEHYHKWDIESFVKYQRNCSRQLITFLLFHPVLLEQKVLGFERLDIKEIYKFKEFLVNKEKSIETSINLIKEIEKINFNVIFNFEETSKNFVLDRLTELVSSLILDVNTYNYYFGIIQEIEKKLEEIIHNLQNNEIKEAYELYKKLNNIGIENIFTLSREDDLLNLLDFLLKKGKSDLENILLEKLEDSIYNNKFLIHSNNVFRYFSEKFFKFGYYDKSMKALQKVFLSKNIIKNDYLLMSNILEKRGDIKTSKKFLELYKTI